MQGPSTFSNIIANTVVVTGTGGGVFIYSGTPGPGNPPVAWTSNGGLKDPYGNALPAVSGVAGTGTFEATDGVQQTVIGASSLTNSGSLRTVAMSDGQLIFGSLVTAFVDNPLHPTRFTVGAIAPNPAACNWELPYLQPLAAVQPNTTTTPETWHSMVPLAGFTAGGEPPRYKLMPDNTVMLGGDINLTAAQAANTAFFGMPSGYVPTQSSVYVNRTTLSGYAAGASVVKCEAGGALRMVPAGNAAGQFFTLDGIRYPLD